MIRRAYYKRAARRTHPNIRRFVFVDPNDRRYDLYAHERDTILHSMKCRAEMITSTLSDLEGVSFNASQGAMYAFPRIYLPPKALDAAAEAGKPADMMYCLELLDSTGIVVVPGSGFGQKDGTLHFRATILPPEEELRDVLLRYSNFHASFMEKYA